MKKNNKKNSPKWKQFEEFVTKLQKKLTPHANVTHNQKIEGKSGIKRQIDVCVRYNLGQFKILAIIDCKDWQRPVDITDVGAFIDLVEDVEANKGAIVCNAGFTKGAKNRAKERGIDLLVAIDSVEKDWQVFITIPVLCDFRKLKSFRFCFRYNSSQPFEIPAGDPKYISVFKKDGSFYDIVVNLLIKAWNTGKLPCEAGTYKKLSFIEDEIYTKIDNKLYGPFEITVDLIVEQKLFSGKVPLQKAQGFANETTGAFTTKSIELGIDVIDVENNWRQIKTKKELAIKPVMVLVTNDFYPLIDCRK